MGQGSQERGKGILSLETFQNLMSECGRFLYELDLFHWGEPLLNPNLVAMIELAKRWNIRVTVGSNLSLLTRDLCEQLIRSGLDHLIVSLHGASQQTMERYQRGNDLQHVVESIRLFMETRKRLKSIHPKVSWRFLVHRYNEREVDIARSKAKELNVDVLDLAPLRCDMGKELFMDSRTQLQQIENWLPSEEAYSLYDYRQRQKKRIRNNDCDWLWTRSAIQWNGAVSPCCAVWPERHDFGNLRDQSFFRVWNGPRYKKARAMVAGKIPLDRQNICGICISNRAQI